jgi:hypothetical protein
VTGADRGITSWAFPARHPHPDPPPSRGRGRDVNDRILSLRLGELLDDHQLVAAVVDDLDRNPPVLAALERRADSAGEMVPNAFVMRCP